MKLSKVGRSASLDRTCLKLNLTNVPGRSSRESVINGKKYLRIESTDDTVCRWIMIQTRYHFVRVQLLYLRVRFSSILKSIYTSP